MSLGILQVVGLGAGEEDCFTVGAPGGVALDVLGVIGAFERDVFLLHSVVAGDDAFDGKKSWE